MIASLYVSVHRRACWDRQQWQEKYAHKAHRDVTTPDGKHDRMWTITETSPGKLIKLGCKAGLLTNPYVGLSDGQDAVYAMRMNTGKYVVYDKSHHVFVKDFSWYELNSYAACKPTREQSRAHPDLCEIYKKKRGKDIYMHDFILRYCEREPCPPGKTTVDHCNWEIQDNRKKNLRWADMSDQNSNRGDRSDKEPPAPELQAAGIDRYPRHIRYDRSEGKFIIEKHPLLVQECKEGLRKKPNMSCTKGRNLSLMQKYQDALRRLQELDDRYLTDELRAFETLKEQNRREFDEILEAVAYARPEPNQSRT